MPCCKHTPSPCCCLQGLWGGKGRNLKSDVAVLHTGRNLFPCILNSCVVRPGRWWLGGMLSRNPVSSTSDSAPRTSLTHKHRREVLPLMPVHTSPVAHTVGSACGQFVAWLPGLKMKARHHPFKWTTGCLRSPIHPSTECSRHIDSVRLTLSTAYRISRTAGLDRPPMTGLKVIQS